MTNKIKKLVFNFFKMAIFTGSYGYIAYRLYFEDEFRNNLFGGTHESYNYFWLFLTIILMPVNWGLESFKWKFLLQKTEQIPFYKTFGGIFAGISVGIFTPNRMGEYFGRIWILRQRNRIQGISLTIIGSIAQTFVTSMMGVLMGWIWVSTSTTTQLTTTTQVCFASVTVIVGLLIYFKLPSIAQFASKFWTNKFYQKFVLGVQQLPLNTLTITLVFSILRYVVFVFQFILLLWFFNVDITTREAIIAIAFLYATMLIIPTIAISEAGVRGSISLFIFSVFSTNKAGVLSASLTLWLINLAVPALFGAIVLAAQKFKPND